MATPTPSRQWVSIAILALMWSTLALAHVVKPPAPKPARLRKLQIDKNNQPETNNLQASDSARKATEDPDSKTDKTEASASDCSGGGSMPENGGIYGEGHGSGGTTFGFHNIFPFPGLPFGGLVPEVSTWGEGGGSGGSNTNPVTGTGISCP